MWGKLTFYMSEVELSLGFVVAIVTLRATQILNFFRITLCLGGKLGYWRFFLDMSIPPSALGFPYEPILLRLSSPPSCPYPSSRLMLRDN